MTGIRPASGEGVTRRSLFMGASAGALAAALPGVVTESTALAAPAAPRGPLTLAELKDLSERAVPILQRHFPMALGDDSLFLAEAGENYHGLRIRCDCPKRPGKLVRCTCEHHPLAGTPMTGGMSGYYEPEWDERTTYELLSDFLRWSERPGSMTDAEWIESLAIIDMTPASHAEQMAWFKQPIDCTDPTPTEAEGGRETASPTDLSRLSAQALSTGAR